MISSDELSRMSQLQINQIETGMLRDIGSVKISPNLTAAKRMESYLGQIENPYCFLCGNTPVKIEFTSHAKPLDEKLLDYFTGLKNR